MYKLYSLKWVAKYLAIAVATIVFWRMTIGFGAIVTAILAMTAVARKKPMELLFWTLFMALSACGNRQVFVVNIISVLTVRCAFLILAIMLFSHSTGGDRVTRITVSFWGLLTYLAWECAISFQGFEPIVSYLKLFLFFSVFIVVLGVAAFVSNSENSDESNVRAIMLCIVSIIIVGSILVIPLPGIAYMSDEDAIVAMLAGETTSLFRGMTNHSQALGPIVAITGTFLFADLAFYIRSWDKFYLLLIAAAPVLIYKSSSRTGMGALIAGVGMAVFFMLRARGLNKSWRGRLTMAVNTLVFITVIAVCAVPSLRTNVGSFMLKWNTKQTSEVTVEGMLSTRQGKIDIAINNFKKKPLLGNGFQVSEDMMMDNRKDFKDYLAAPIEKGVWIYAILEEGGVVGLALFVFWFIGMLVAMARRQLYVGASVFFSFIISNLGEFSMFSMTYTGGFYWMFTIAATCLDIQRIKRERGMFLPKNMIA